MAQARLPRGPWRGGEGATRPSYVSCWTVLEPREANLIDADKKGTTITYQLKMSVLEDALLGFAETFGFEPKQKIEEKET